MNPYAIPDELLGPAAVSEKDAREAHETLQAVRQDGELLPAIPEILPPPPADRRRLDLRRPYGALLSRADYVAYLKDARDNDPNAKYSFMEPNEAKKAKAEAKKAKAEARKAARAAAKAGKHPVPKRPRAHLLLSDDDEDTSADDSESMSSESDGDDEDAIKEHATPVSSRRSVVRSPAEERPLRAHVTRNRLPHWASTAATDLSAALRASARAAQRAQSP